MIKKKDINYEIVIDILKKNNIQFDSLTYIKEFDNILVYILYHNNKKYILKIQILNGKNSIKLYNEKILINKLSTNNLANNKSYNNKLFNNISSNHILLIKENGYFYKTKEYIIIISEEIDYILLEKESINITKNDILTQLLDIIEYFHSNHYLYLYLSVDNIAIIKGKVKIILYNPLIKYIDSYSMFIDNIKVFYIAGDIIYGSLNINNLYCGVRMDDIESLLWIYLFLINDKIIKKLLKSKSLQNIINIKKKFIEENSNNILIKEFNKYSNLSNEKPNYKNFKKILNII